MTVAIQWTTIRKAKTRLSKRWQSHGTASIWQRSSLWGVPSDTFLGRTPRVILFGFRWNHVFHLVLLQAIQQPCFCSVGNVCQQGPRSDPKWFPATRLHPCRSWAWPVLIWKPVGLWGHHRLHGFWSLDLRGRNRYILGAITFFAKALCWATGTSKICCQTPRLSTHVMSVNHAKVAKAFGQIAPRNAFPITVEHCLDKEAITLGSHADGSRPVGDNCPMRCPWSSRRA